MTPSRRSRTSQMTDTTPSRYSPPHAFGAAITIKLARS
jgi:hypothetical protein